MSSPFSYCQLSNIKKGEMTASVTRPFTRHQNIGLTDMNKDSVASAVAAALLVSAPVSASATAAVAPAAPDM